MPEASAAIHRSDVPQKPTTIYALQEPDTLAVRYVGATTLPLARRLSYHMTMSRKKADRDVRVWIADLFQRGLEPTIISLEIVPPGPDWVVAERRWIEWYRAQGGALTNMTDGGDGGYGSGYLALTPAHREAISAANAGRKFGPEACAAMSVAAKKRGISPATLKAAHTANRRENQSPEAKERRRLALLGKKLTIRPDDPRKRPIVMDGRRFGSLTEAAAADGVTKSAILARIQRGRASYATD